MSKNGGEVEQDDINEEELRRRYYERLSDWSEPGEIKINRNGKLLNPLVELPKWKRSIPWVRPKR
jgi:hypothetical protein